MKSVKVPYISDLETMTPEEREVCLEASGARVSVDTLNWPQDWPYRPAVSALLARSENYIFVSWHVHGLDLRAEALEDNGPVWEDSCCEFFVSDPADGSYYNFEMNCVGTLLGAKRKSREDCVHFQPEVLRKVMRTSSLSRRKYDLSGGVHTWDLVMGIPFELIGVRPEALPKSLRANLYKCGDKTAHPHFLSWNPIDVPSPDFHRPEFFGELLFE